MSESYKLRSDLIIKPQGDGERAVYVVKDPVTGRFFQLRPPEYFLISQMDGRTSITEVEQRFKSKFGIHLPQGAAQGFFRKMQRLCLFEGVYAEAALAGQKRQAGRGGPLSRLLTWPIASFNPDHLIGRLERRTRWLFTPEVIVLSFLVIGLSLTIAVANHATFFLRISQIFQVGSIIGILGAVFVIAVFHEFAHAVALKRYGGSVGQMGFMLLYFQPCVYCNLSDAYLLHDRKQKATVMLAGLFVQMLVTAAAILVWRITDLGTVINRFSFLVAAVSLAVALFNLNPLIKLDGYYLLADLLGLPNLRSRAFGYLRRRLRAWATGRDESVADDRHGRIFAWYGVIALAYSGFLLAFIGYLLTSFLATRFGWAGPLILWGTIAVLLARPLWRTKTGDQAEKLPASPPSPPDGTMNEKSQSDEKKKLPRRPIIFWGTIGLLLIASFFIHAERRVGSECRVEPSAFFAITNPEAGIIEAEFFAIGTTEIRRRTSLQLASADFSAVEISPRFGEGETVYAGDTVLVISSNRYANRLASTQAQLQKAHAELNLLFAGPKEEEQRQLLAELRQVEAQLRNDESESARAGQMHERKLISDEKYELMRTQVAVSREGKVAKESELSLLISGPKIEEIAVKEAEIAELEANVEYYRSQIAASVFVAPFTGRVSQVRSGKRVFTMVRTDTLRVVIPVSEDDIGDVYVGAPVRLKVRAFPHEEFDGRVARLAVAADNTGANSQYEVLTIIPNPAERLLPGMTGYAKISCGDRRVASLAFRRVVYFFRVEFWSWW